VRASIERLRIAFIGRDELVKNTAASGRAKDLADLALLEEVGQRAQSMKKRRRARSKP
jgi:hypothetical protein